MRAIQASHSSLHDVELPPPEPGPHDLLVAIEGLAINPVDLKLQAALAEGERRQLGWDAAGTVVATGPAVEHFRPGDGVWFMGSVDRPGCQAEQVLVDEALVGHRPPGLDPAAAAALPLTGLTAWEALFDRLRLDPQGGDAGRSLLILGGGGGVGSVAIQLARRAGLTVIASASRPASRAWIEDLGATAVVDHRQPLRPQMEALGHPSVGCILNAADTDGCWDVMADLIAPEGAIVALVGSRRPLDLERLKARSVSFHWEFVFTRPRGSRDQRQRQGRILEQLATLVEDGCLRSTERRRLAPISATSLERAYADLRQGHTLGKTVLTGWG